MKTATIYARVSSTGDRQDTARQVEDLTAYAQRNELEVVKVFTEKYSGYKKRSERPVFDECLKFCVTNKVDVLLLSEISRFGRDSDDILKNVLFCKETKQNVFFQKEKLSIFTDEGKEHPFLNIFIAVLAAVAQIEGENIKFRLNSGREKYIRDGGKLGRREGYRKPPEDYRRDYPEVFKELRRKDRLSYDRIAKLCDVSKNTVITCARIAGVAITPSNEKIEE